MPVVDKLMAAAQRKPEWADKPAGQGNGRGPARHPLILKVLAALNFLAKDQDPDDLEQVARISVSTESDRIVSTDRIGRDMQIWLLF